jgi:hypothetical protein
MRSATLSSRSKRPSGSREAAASATAPRRRNRGIRAGGNVASTSTSRRRSRHEPLFDALSTTAASRKYSPGDGRAGDLARGGSMAIPVRSITFAPALDEPVPPGPSRLSSPLRALGPPSLSRPRNRATLLFGHDADGSRVLGVRLVEALGGDAPSEPGKDQTAPRSGSSRRTFARETTRSLRWRRASGVAGPGAP